MPRQPRVPQSTAAKRGRPVAAPPPPNIPDPPPSPTRSEVSASQPAPPRSPSPPTSPSSSSSSSHSSESQYRNSHKARDRRRSNSSSQRDFRISRSRSRSPQSQKYNSEFNIAQSANQLVWYNYLLPIYSNPHANHNTAYVQSVKGDGYCLFHSLLQQNLGYTSLTLARQLAGLLRPYALKYTQGSDSQLVIAYCSDLLI